MAARILPFRSLVPAIRQAAFSPVPGALLALRGQRGAKVVTMSKHARSRLAYRKHAVRDEQFAPAEGELTQGFVEVEITGISLRRVTEVYAVLLRGAWATALDSVRLLLRPAASTEGQTISLANRNFGG